MADTKFELRKRYIVRDAHTTVDSFQEVTVLEISPLKDFIRLQHESGAKIWHKINKYTIVERLAAGRNTR